MRVRQGLAVSNYKEPKQAQKCHSYYIEKEGTTVGSGVPGEADPGIFTNYQLD